MVVPILVESILGSAAVEEWVRGRGEDVDTRYVRIHEMGKFEDFKVGDSELTLT